MISRSAPSRKSQATCGAMSRLFGSSRRTRSAGMTGSVRFQITPRSGPLDPGPDGIVNSADDRTITVFETGVPPDMTDYYLTNKAIGDTYDTVEFGVTKRMSDHWQMISGVDWTKRDLASLFSEDPNTVLWNSTNTQTTGWTFKASGSYVFNHGLLVGVSYNAMKGEPYGRIFHHHSSST